MSVSSLFGSPILLLPNSSSKTVPAQFHSTCFGTGNGGLVIECSSRPKKKATAHHMKTRPKKSQPWDIKRKPTVYPPLPVLPPDWTIVSSASDDADADSDTGSAPEVALPSAPDLQAPIASG